MSDALMLRGRNGLATALFWGGAGLLALSSVAAAWQGPWFQVALLVRVVVLALAAVAGWLEAKAILMPSAPRTEAGSRGLLPLKDTGMYALCRHPGALWLPLLYLCLGLGLGNIGLLKAGAIASGLNIVYVAIQDYFVFPRTIEGYQAYKARTPFLLPTQASLKAALGRPDHRQD